MIDEFITVIPTNQILFDQAARQRSLIDPVKIFDLAISIGLKNWINPILVRKSDHRLIAGGRRLTAVGLLNAAHNGTFDDLVKYLAEVYHWDLSRVSSDRIETVRRGFTSSPGLADWTRIPVQYGIDLNDTEVLIFEFIENKEREDMAWQDKCRAIYDIHSKLLLQKDKWTAAHTAKLLSIDPADLSRYLRIWRAHMTGDGKLQQIIASSQSYMAALAALDRVEDRRAKPVQLSIDDDDDDDDDSGIPSIPMTLAVPGYNPPPFTLADQPPTSPTPVKDSESVVPSFFLNKDFHDFARNYIGAPFNFLHIDFPYGINLGTGPGQRTNVDNAMSSAYEDSPDIYWSLLKTLSEYSSSLIALSAHVLFWYSQEHEDETKAFFKENFPEARLHKFKMIWHCSDNSGIMPDPQRYGRRTYETAFLLTFGDRKIVNGRALSVAAPRTNHIHRSQKPYEVLLHFFGMFVDETTNMFDPTAGSGTSLIAAHKAGARSILGLELDPQIHARGTKYITQELNI